MMSKLPVDRSFMFVDEDLVGPREMLAAEEGTAGQGRRMCSFEDIMPGSVDQLLLGPGEIAP